jgi:hypothetical protein
MKANADPQNNCITQRLSLYTTAAAGAVFASGVCAATTPSPNAPASFTVPDGTSDTLEFDIDGDGTVDLQFYASAASAGDPCEYPATNPGYAYVQGLDGNEIAREDYGGYASLVSGSFPAGGESTSSFAPFLSCQYSDGEDQATFEVGPGGVSNSGFVGVQFASGGETLNAVLQMQFEEGSLTTNIVYACYNTTPGEPVNTDECVILSGGGSPTAVPAGKLAVPLSLGLLALGGLALYRRQRAFA